MTDDRLSADLALALRMADAADVLTMARFRASDLLVESKPDLTPVTDADRDVEAAIRQTLASRRPHDSFVGEESGSGVVTSRRRWIVDPIDGTANFVRGVPIWASLIALVIDGDPVVGVVSAPALGRRWSARRGAGAYCHEAAGSRRIVVSGVSRLQDASLAYASLGGWRSIDRYQQFLQLTDQVWRTRGYGDFYSYMLLAEGAVDLVAEPELSLWDMAALAPIVTEAGGRFTGIDGIDGIQRGNALASNGFLHEAALSVIGTSPIR